MSAPTEVAVASGIVKRYRGRTVLDRVDLVATHGLTGVLGPNGAGKTTLLRILATVAAPDAGSVRVLGLDADDTRERQEIRRRLGYQPQEPGFFQGFTARAFIDYVAVLKGIVDSDHRRDETVRVLDLVDLTPQADVRIRRLSGGMRRRVAIATSLLGRPELLILDEPTAGLDPEQRFRFREVLSGMAERSAVVLSTHQTDDVAALCDRVVVLHEGQVRFCGSPAELTRLAEGRVWVADAPTAGAVVAWRDGQGRHRQVGEAPAGADLVPATLEDGYLLLLDHARELA